MMKKLFFFLALLLPIGAWAQEIVIAERDWTGCTEEEIPFYEFGDGQEGSVTASEEGLVITLPKLSDEFWLPQTMILDGAYPEKGQDYTVRITAKIPSDGQLVVNMGTFSFSAAEHKVVDVKGSDDFQIIDIMFPDFPYAEAHILFQSGFIVGTCIIKKVQIFRKVNIWTLAGDESLVGKDWDVSSTINNMITLDGEVYTITKKNLTLSKGTYHFKVYKNNLMDESYPSSDATLVIDEEGVYTVKFTFNANAKELSAIAKKQTAGEFETAAEAVKNMKIGWNLVNTLDSYGSEDLGLTKPQDWETCWGNPVTKPELIKMIRKAGFNTMRIPVTWFLHTDAQGNIDPAWMKRVHEVVDYVIDQGMYCILNTHHDTAGDVDEETGVITRPAKLIADPDNYRENKEWFEKLWRQIAEEFKDYDEHLLFEGYNEMADKYGAWFGPNGDYGAEHVQQVYDAINDYAQSFVNAVRSTGGKNLERNLVVSTYTAALGPGIDWGTEACRQMKVPQDVTFDHIAFEVHCYWFNGRKEADEVISTIKQYFSFRGVPTIVGEYAMDLRDVDFYFTKKAKENDIAPIIWSHIVSDGNFREYPAFDASNKVEAALKAYYGDWYEPQLLTLDDYESQGVKVSYDYQWAELRLCGDLNPNEYKGIRVEVEKVDGLAIKVYGDPGEEQFLEMTSASESLVFDKSIIGDKISLITLMNTKEGKNEIKIINVWLMKADGTEEMLKLDAYNVYRVYHGCEYEVISTRKQFVHTVEFDGLWAELNLFSDDIPLKLKKYKGIRLELAEMPKYDTCHLKVYGDGEKNTDDIGLTGTSTTIIFNPEIFSSEINRVTLISDMEDKFTAKVLCAYLIRQDGTEEYSDLSIFHDCKIEGDVNNDGKVDSTDVKAIVELIMKGEYKAKADVNGDSKVNAADIVVVTNEIK